MTDEQKLLLQTVVEELIVFIAEDEHLDTTAAMKKLYESKYFEKLNNIATNLYRESSGYNYEVYKKTEGLA